MGRTVLPLVLVAAGGCDYGGDFLFAQSHDVDDIWILEGPDGGAIVPSEITSADDIRAATIYAEVGYPLTTAYGGVTLGFVGTGSDICLWVDPEIAFWSQAVAARPAEGAAKWSYPDNMFDDGDLDLLAGLSVYYTGSPGEEIGDFVVDYEDSLGNEVPISLANCPNQIGLQDDFAAAGRGSPEFCTITNSELGIDYTAVLRTWSTPLDDDRLGFGVIVANGTCDNMRRKLLPQGVQPTPLVDECLVQGEAITPNGKEYGPFYGFDELNEAGRIWNRSIDFEATYCDIGTRMQTFCNEETEDMKAAGSECEWHAPPTQDNRCYCGNPDDTPEGGAI